MRLLAITDRSLLPGQHTPGRLRPEERSALVTLARGWAEGGVEFIQIREKDLERQDLLLLTRALAEAVAPAGATLLLNGSADVAREGGARGVHLPGGWSPASVAAARSAFCPQSGNAVVAAACRSAEEAEMARMAGLDLALFAPVFEKRLYGGAAVAGQGLQALSRFCLSAAPVPVFALGGVDADNATACLLSGAAGIAAIRLFLTPEWRRLAA